MWFDINRKGVWIKSVIEYYTVGVKKFYVPVRWLTEIRDFWPQLFGEVVAGEKWMGYGIVLLGVVALIIAFKKRLINQKVVVMLTVLIGQVLLMRFYKGTRSREYMIAFQPLIIIITGWVLVTITQWQRSVGVVIMTGIVIIAGINNWDIVNRKTQTKIIYEIKNDIESRYPNEKILVKSYPHSEMVAMPLVLLTMEENGEEVAVKACDSDWNKCEVTGLLSSLKGKYYVYKDEDKTGVLTPERIYKETIYVNYGE
jgi:hypothetical protein